MTRVSPLFAPEADGPEVQAADDPEVQAQDNLLLVHQEALLVNHVFVNHVASPIR